MTREVVVDARWLHSGIGTYTLNLLSQLRRYSNGLVVRALGRQQDAARLGSLCEGVTVVDVPIYTLREQFAVPWGARGADLLHVPHYNAPVLYRRKLLVTIHDLVHITDPVFRLRPATQLYARAMLHQAARKACHIITGSHYSKAQIVERLHVPVQKISVIPYGVGDHFHCLDRAEAFRKLSEFLSVRLPYVLYVGNLKPHKNVVALIRAFGLLRARRAMDHQLVIVGDDPKWKQALVQEAAALKLEGTVFFISHISDDLLPQVYGAADLFVLPSSIEGFGLPVVEAMACGTPVVCSRAASLPEVAGDAAEYFDPSSVEDLAAALERVLESSDLRVTMRRKGLEQARRFSWDECARRHCEVYRDLLQA